MSIEYDSNRYFNLTKLVSEDKIDIIIQMIETFLIDDDDFIDLSNKNEVPMNFDLNSGYKVNDEIYLHKRYLRFILELTNKRIRNENNRTLKETFIIKTYAQSKYETLLNEGLTERYYTLSLIPIENNIYEIQFNVNDYKTIFGIKNSVKFLSMLNLQLKMFGLDEVEMISNNKIKILNMCVFIEICECIKNKTKYEGYDIMNVTRRYVNHHDSSSRNFIPQMFEYFCSWKLNVPIYKYEPMEVFKLGRNDIGVDLISKEQKILVQCKCYRGKNGIQLSELKTFYNMCNKFSSYRRILAINEDCKLSGQSPLTNLEIIRMKNDEFQDFINLFTNNVTIKLIPKQTLINKSDIKLRQMPNSITLNNVDNTDLICYNDTKELSWTSDVIGGNTGMNGYLHTRTYTFSKLPGKSIIQRLNDGMIHLNEFTTNIMHENQNQVSRYINSYPFQVIMKTIDSTIKLPNIVYLIKGNDYTFKIGVSSDFEHNYLKDIRLKADHVIYVDDETRVKQVLIETYKQDGYEYIDDSDIFKYTSFKEVQEIFNGTIQDYKCEYQKPTTSLIKQKSHGHVVITHINIHLLQFIVYKYISDKNYSNLVNEFIDLIIKQTTHIYSDVLYEKTTNQLYDLKVIFGIVIIRNKQHKLINISRLRNSISNLIDIPSKKPSEFLRSKICVNNEKIFKQAHPNEIFAISNYQSTDQPYFNGSYLTYQYVVDFIRWLVHSIDISNDLIIYRKTSDQIDNIKIPLRNVLSFIEYEISDDMIHFDVNTRSFLERYGL